MASTAVDPFLKGNTGRNTRGLLRIVILCTIAAAAIASRLFSVIRMLQLTIRNYEYIWLTVTRL